MNYKILYLKWICLLLIYFILEIDDRMSDSYKRTPVLKEKRRKKIYKRQVNDAIRKLNLENIDTKSNNYKKHYDSWNINDYAIYFGKLNALIEFRNEFESEEECVQE